MGKADLHTHTEASDGTVSVDDRVREAEELGFDAIAITDHDIINEDIYTSDYNSETEVIVGVEVSCEVDGTGIEILGYFVDPEDRNLNEILETAREYREDRLRELTSNVSEMISGTLTWEDVNEHIGQVAVRPHLARALENKGVVEDENEAFDRFLTSGCETYVEAEKLPAKEVIDTIHGAGGVTSLAHPGRDLEDSMAEEKVEELVSYGLDGIEVPYTYQHKLQDGYSINFQQPESYELKEQFGLIMTGGSDCHGEGDPGRHNIGKIELDMEYVEDLREKSREYPD